MKFSPSFIKRDPATGLTFYDFDGHIHAKGLDLGAWTALFGIPESPPVQRETHSVRWVGDTVGLPGGVQAWEGALLAEIYTEDAGGVGQIHLQPVAAPGAPGPGHPTVFAMGKMVIDSLGRSDLTAWSAWAPVTFGGAFSNLQNPSTPTGYNTCQWRYWQNSFGQGEVQLRGMAKGIAAFGGGYAILTGLPLVPPTFTNHLAYGGPAAGGVGIQRLQADPTGNLYFSGVLSGPAMGAVGDAISLDNVSIPIGN